MSPAVLDEHKTGADAERIARETLERIAAETPRWPRWFRSTEAHREWFLANDFEVPMLFRFTPSQGWAYICNVWRCGNFTADRDVHWMIENGLRLGDFVEITRAEASAMTGGNP